MNNPQHSASDFLISLSILMTDIQNGKWENVDLRCYRIGQWADLEPMEFKSARESLNELIRSLNQSKTSENSSTEKE